MNIGRMFIALGVFFLVIGFILTAGAKLPIKLGRLPGDIYFQGRNSSFYFPVVTCLLLSVVFSLVVWLLRR